MNKRQIQAMALAYIAEKANQGIHELAHSGDDSGMEYPDCFKGWFIDADDFFEWLENSGAKFKAHKREIFDCMQGLIGLQ